MDIEESYKKFCECDSYGYEIQIFPHITCPSCRKGNMTEKKNCICYLCLQANFVIPDRNCQSCVIGEMKEIKFYNE